MRSFIIQNRETKGPYTIGQLRSMWSSGAITGDTLYREEGSDDWNTLAAISADLEQTQQSDHPIHTPPPPMRSQSAPTPGRQQGKPRSVAMVFGLGCLSVIGLIVLLGIVGAILNGVS